jgi:hypothetical protein
MLQNVINNTNQKINDVISKVITNNSVIQIQHSISSTPTNSQVQLDFVAPSTLTIVKDVELTTNPFQSCKLQIMLLYQCTSKDIITDRQGGNRIAAVVCNYKLTSHSFRRL